MGIEYLEYLEVYEMIILKYILKYKYVDFIQLERDSWLCDFEFLTAVHVLCLLLVSRLLGLLLHPD
jgi:hypothetical protein